MIEILIAMAVSLIGFLIMFQLLSDSEARKRTTASGSDAQINGSISLYHLERDIQQAGYGFGNAASGMMGCSIAFSDTARPIATNNYTFTMAPVVIVPGNGAVPDELLILYGNSATVPDSEAYSNTTSTTKQIDTSGSRTGIRRGDLVLVAGSSQCGLVEITDDTTANNAVSHTGGQYTAADGSTQSARYSTAGFTGDSSGMLYSLGQRLFVAGNSSAHLNHWVIRGQGQGNRPVLAVSDELNYIDQLTQTAFPSTSTPDGINDWIEVGDGIINLKAEYGIDTNGDYIVDTWQSAAPAAADWNKIIAIHVAVLARSPQYEKTAVTTTIPFWTRPATPTLAEAQVAFTMANVDGSTDSGIGTLGVNNWRNYRYRVYETTVPLRNIIWGQQP